MAATFVVFFLIIEKTINKNWRFTLNEMIIFILAGLLYSAVRVYIIQRGTLAFSISEISSYDFIRLVLLLIPFLNGYFRFWKSFSWRTTIVLSTFMIIMVGVCEYITEQILYFFVLGWFQNSSSNLSIAVLQMIAYNVLLLGQFATMIILAAKYTKGLRRTIMEGKWIQRILPIFCLLPLVAVIITLGYVNNNNIETQLSPRAIAIRAIVPLFIIMFILGIGLVHQRYKKKRREEERKNLLRYITELEQQQVDISKFKHDYRNIIFSLQGFIEKGDWTGLEKYYSQKIEKVPEAIGQESFPLSDLSKIKNLEIKGVLVAKLVLVQSMNIRAKVLVNKEIENFTIDTEVLIQILEALIDNSIEELMALGGGELYLSCIKTENEISVVVGNTCRLGSRSHEERKKLNYSPKGMELNQNSSTISELIKDYPNLAIHIKTKEGLYIQELIIVDP